MPAASKRNEKSLEMIMDSPSSSLAAKEKTLCQIYMAISAFLLVLRRIYSSPRYLGPEWRSFNVRDLVLNTLEGFSNLFLFLTGATEFYDLMRPGSNTLGSSDLSYSLSILSLAFVSLSLISSSSSPQKHVRHHHKHDDFRSFYLLISFFVGIRFSL